MPLYEGETLKEAIQKAVGRTTNSATLGTGSNQQITQATRGESLRCEIIERQYQELYCAVQSAFGSMDSAIADRAQQHQTFLRHYAWLYDRRPANTGAIGNVRFPDADRFEEGPNAVRDYALAVAALGRTATHPDHFLRPLDRNRWPGEVRSALSELEIISRMNRRIEEASSDYDVHRRALQNLLNSPDGQSCLRNIEQLRREIQCPNPLTN